VLGGAVLLGTVATGAVADIPFVALVMQSLFPLVVGLGMVAYGWVIRDEFTVATRRTVVTWAAVGVAGFFVVGFWFGQTSRLLETSFLVAVYSSLTAGAAFGATVGVYAARLRRSNETLQRETDRLEEFASIVSHDLRTPLGVAKARLALARDDAEVLGEASDHLADVNDALDRMEAMLEELLALAREGEPTGTERVRLAAVADRCWSALHTGDVDLVVTDDVTVLADAGLLQQLLENLLANAAEHGGDSVTVGRLPGGFYVADDGPGVPEGERDQVFKTGYTTAESGTGVGLSVVEHVADGHGWDMTVTESATGGVRFEVTGVDVDG